MKQTSGAEAIIIFKKDSIIKKRVSKSYRIPQIDEKFTKLRTRKEAKMLELLKQKKILAPLLLSVDEKEKTIQMSRIQGEQVKKSLTRTNYQHYAKKIATLLCQLHKNDIIHADLTTSNMIVSKNDEIVFIDFGLSYVSKKIEDKAVDLHLLKESLESYHYTIAAEMFALVLKMYKKEMPTSIIERFEVVEKRGKNKH